MAVLESTALRVEFAQIYCTFVQFLHVSPRPRQQAMLCLCILFSPYYDVLTFEKQTFLTGERLLLPGLTQGRKGLSLDHAFDMQTNKLSVIPPLSSSSTSEGNIPLS